MNIKCTQCGAKVPIEKDSDFIRCPYCETALYVDTERTVKHHYMAAQAQTKDLGPMVARKLSYLEVVDPVTVGKWSFFYFPFWRVDTSLGGSVVIAAATPPCEDMLQISMPAGDLKLFAPELAAEHEVTEPEMLLDDALIEAQKILDNPAVKFTAASLIHLPMYRVEYRCQNQDFVAVVDAITGDAFADEWPAMPQKQKDRMLGGIALAAFALFFLEAAFLPWTWAIIPAYALTGAGIYYLARNTLRKMGW